MSVRDVAHDALHLPDSDDAGREGIWAIYFADNTAPREVSAKFLGLGSSHRVAHTEHVDFGEPFARAGERCRACRWFETRIYWLPEMRRYLIYNVGQTVVPNESLRYKAELVVSPFEVVEVLTTRRGSGDPFLSPPAAHALAMGANFDEGIREAYVNRAIA